MQEFSLIFDLEPNNIKLTYENIVGFLHRKTTDEIIITNLENEFDNAPDMSKFRGIYIEFSKNSLKIYTDHFASIPIFYTILDSQIILSNNFKFVASKVEKPTIDQIGFWELFIYENTLLDRTLFKEIKYLQASSYLNFTNGPLEEVRYFNYDYEKKSEVKDSDLDSMIDEMRSYFKDLPDDDYIFPVSGGFDSRLFLSLFDKEKTINNFVTYGFDKKIIENTAAKKVIDLLGYDKRKHFFHKLSEDKYLKDIKELNEMSGGFIGVQNSHLFSYLSDEKIKDTSMISGVLADGIFGYACNPSDDRTSELSASKYYQALNQVTLKYCIAKEISDGIISDLEELFSDWKENKTLSSFDEYFYLRERNSKFMFGLVNVWRRYTNVIIPPLDHKIEKIFMSLPDNTRKHKEIVNQLLARINPKLMKINNVSSIFRDKEIGLGNKFQNLEYKIVRKLNNIFQNRLKLQINFTNRFDTETHNFNYMKYHSNIIEPKIVEFTKKTPGIIPEKILENIEGMRAYQLYSNIYTVNDYLK
ncbi:MAG: hypothetical protein GQ534_09315 [Candidatus Delongbacteria bacterium]|nr:hypothetical protein [Candidatus Delongbacteria bacterium]